MSEKTINITTSLRVERPPSVVRAQYWDIDHHIRKNVHPGILYKWEESKPGARKIRTEFRLLGIKQYDVSLLVDGPDGSFVIDYLEGANAGTKLVHEFLPEGDDATTVRITAHVPANLHRSLLGPLFKWGVKQVINKALREDKADLEAGAFEAGHVAGNIDAALSLVDSLKARIAALGPLGPDAARTALEVAGLVAAADGEVDHAERDALRRVTSVLGVSGLDDGWADIILDQSARLARTEAVVDRVKALGKRFGELGLGRDGLFAAAVVAQASYGVALAELALLRAVANSAGLNEEAVEFTLSMANDALAKTA